VYIGNELGLDFLRACLAAHKYTPIHMVWEGLRWNLVVDLCVAKQSLIRRVKVSTRFSANVKRLVSMKDLSFTRFKAHF